MKINHKSDETRNRILVAAKNHFLKYGYDKTKLEDIVREARVSKTAIYTIFGGKQELFYALNDAILKENIQKLEATIKPMQAKNFEEVRTNLINFGHDYLEIILHPEKLALLRLNISQAHHHPKVTTKFYASGPQTAENKLANFFTFLNEQKILKISDSHIAAASFIALLRGSHHLKALLDPTYQLTRTTLTAHIESVVSQFINGLTAKA